jgi:hypothetical protein
MSLMAEINISLYGVWRLFRRDPNGILLINPTIGAFWRSFWAAILVAPAFILLDAMVSSGEDMLTLRYSLIHVIAYVIDWTAFPVAMLSVTQGMGKGLLYPRYMTAYNWSAVVQMSILLPIALLALSVPNHGTLLLAQAATIILLIYRAFIAHVALQVGMGTSAAIVLLDVLLASAGKLATDYLLKG